MAGKRSISTLEDGSVSAEECLYEHQAAEANHGKASHVKLDWGLEGAERTVAKHRHK